MPAAGAPRSDARTAALLALAVLCACIAVNLPFIATCAVRGDTAALMLHSTRFFPAHPVEWVRQGFERYFINYPEATRPYTGFVRPMVNATFWAESLLARGPNSRAFLLTGYLGHAACTAMVWLAARRLAGVPPRRALLAAALFGGTISALELLHSPAFRADMLGAGFSLAALLAADAWRRGAGGGTLAAACVLLLMSVLSKETAVTGPLLAAAWVAAAPSERPRRRRWAAALALLAPLGVFALVRAGAPPGVYVSATGVRGNLAQVATSAFFPGAGVFDLLRVARGESPPLVAAHALLGLALNLAAAVLVAAALLRRDRRAALLVAAAAGALAVPAVLAPEPRMMYFGQMFALPLLAAVLPRPRAAARALAALSLAAGPAYLLATAAAAQPGLVRGNRESAELQRVLARELRDPRVRRVYLVSDVVGDYAGLALLRGAALHAGRPDVGVRVVNTMVRLAPGERRGTLALRARGEELVLDERCGAGCKLVFPGVGAGDEARLGEPGVIAYRVVALDRVVAAIPERCGALLVGFTPAAPGVHVLRPCDTAWRRVSER
ncbi:MAG: hypothetical protein ACJ8GN_11455 [Longimicrobiaceae bacterium]